MSIIQKTLFRCIILVLVDSKSFFSCFRMGCISTLLLVQQLFHLTLRDWTHMASARSVCSPTIHLDYAPQKQPPGLPSLLSSTSTCLTTSPHLSGWKILKLCRQKPSERTSHTHTAEDKDWLWAAITMKCDGNYVLNNWVNAWDFELAQVCCTLHILLGWWYLSLVNVVDK